MVQLCLNNFKANNFNCQTNHQTDFGLQYSNSKPLIITLRACQQAPVILAYSHVLHGHGIVSTTFDHRVVRTTQQELSTFGYKKVHALSIPTINTHFRLYLLLIQQYPKSSSFSRNGIRNIRRPHLDDPWWIKG